MSRGIFIAFRALVACAIISLHLYYVRYFTTDNISVLSAVQRSSLNNTFVTPTWTDNAVLENKPSLLLPISLEATKSQMTICVLSRRGAFDVRETIRETWANGLDNVYFVVGTPCLVPLRHQKKTDGRAEGRLCRVEDDKPLPRDYPLHVRNWTKGTDEEDRRLVEEQARNKDILFTNPVDFYDTLPLKLKGCYELVSKFLPETKWVVKVDDDFFVDVNMLHTKLATYDHKVPTLVGNIVSGSPARGGKWKELPQYPTAVRYPNFPLGSYGHAVTRPVAEYITRHSRELFDYQGEDVSLGIWLHQSDMNAKYISGLQFMTNNKRCDDVTKAVIGHSLKMEDILLCETRRNHSQYTHARDNVRNAQNSTNYW